MGILEKVLEIKTQIRHRMNGEVAENMRREGIIYKVNYGVSIPELQQLAKGFAGDHELAQELYREEIRECKIIASMIDNPAQVTGAQIDAWAGEFDNPEIVEQVCTNLICKSEYALSRSVEWCLGSNALLQKAGFITIARNAPNSGVKTAVFEPYLEIIEAMTDTISGTTQSAIVFALREIGRHRPELEGLVLKTAQRLTESANGLAVWAGNQAIFELGYGNNDKLA